MLKVRILKPGERLRSASPSKTVRTKRVRGDDGKMTEVAVLDVDSKSFADDFLAVFRRNVARARRENARLFKDPDGVKLGRQR